MHKYERPAVGIIMVSLSQSSYSRGCGRKRFLHTIESPDLGGFDLCMLFLGPALLGILWHRLPACHQPNSAFYRYSPVVLHCLPIAIGIYLCTRMRTLRLSAAIEDGCLSDK